MVSLPLQTELRGTLYYNKYKYKANFTLKGARRTYGLTSIEKFKERIANSNGYYKAKLTAFDIPAIDRFMNWRTIHASEVRLRIEQDTVCVFSNDLPLLNTLDKIDPSMKVTCYQIDDNIPIGIKYFVREPKYKYRAYLKGRIISDHFRQDLIDFEQRYLSSGTEIHFSKGLRMWLNRVKRYGYMYTTQSSFFIDYNQESTLALLSIMFTDMIGKRYKLEKQPN